MYMCVCVYMYIYMCIYVSARNSIYSIVSLRGLLRTCTSWAPFWLFRISQKVTSLFNLIYRMTKELTFENFYELGTTVFSEFLKSELRISQKPARYSIYSIEWPRSWLVRIFTSWAPWWLFRISQKTAQNFSKVGLLFNLQYRMTKGLTCENIYQLGTVLTFEKFSILSVQFKLLYARAQELTFEKIFQQGTVLTYQKFSKVSPLFNLLYAMTKELTFSRISSSRTLCYPSRNSQKSAAQFTIYNDWEVNFWEYVTVGHRADLSEILNCQLAT